ncbi:cation channel sperm-associated auxiliary subunit gamma isoform X4 [Pongo abelii]|uniref:cation channel sperm-associated auxiliary subunit gamma isoform X4 n=1 Tax=Pongo abelii TaxID=9601 RepID=UPI0023E31D31|nr:cation channel sperm-associated auxiliary subunit gamma isoform X3 [Pongo pygmaeus]XP_054396303.1 cation channel sperm-associated auxiliary subunit gamma isoform X4 [Pongo abelii]
MCGTAMFPAGPPWSRVRVLQVLWALLAVLLASWRLWAIKDFQECTWQVVLNEFKRVGESGVSDSFFEQEPVDTVSSLFHMLVDSPLNPSEKYLGFPYYLKINYSCEEKPSEDLVRMGHLTGLKPLVLVTFQSPVNFYRWKIEQLQIQMEAAPFRSKEPCMAEEVCSMSWYTPMPIKNGSVVMRVDVSSNGLGSFIPDKRFQMNINGFLKRDQDNNIQFTVGEKLFDLMPRYFVGVSSRPLWHTVDQSPVLILGGIPNEKYVLMTDTSFKDFSLVELSIDSCWVGSFYCPHSGFTATIYDTIATESTLFIRQNQLVYYFTGTYTTLYERNRGSGSWVRVLASECIKKLCPVYFHSNGSEYIMALTMGKHEGYVYFGTIRDGQVSFEMLPRKWSVCEQIGASDDLELLYHIPEFIPEARGLEFLMILGTESYTSTAMAPKGIFCNPYNNLIFIWGNFLLQSSNKENFIYLADFPKELSIKYMARSFRGAVAIVTETEEIWYLLEGSYRVYQLFPSKGWQVHISLQLMQQSSLYASNETMLTLFYEDSKLYQLVYLMNNQKGQLVKRLMPVEQLLMYQQHTSRYDLERKGGYLMLSFINFCPFSVMRLRSLPRPQRYTRQERYRARPPRVLERSGFHNENSLAIYQGLVYYLLWLHSVYDKPYADPVHDPTWRWWENNKQDQDYYFFLASNWRSSGGVSVEMDSYEKIYNLESAYELPERIFLDKGTEYSFAIFLSAQGHTFRTQTELGAAFQLHSQVDVGVVLADPACIEASVKQEVMINRNSVLFSITLKDKKLCYDQGISGHHLMKTSMTVNVVGSSGLCFQETHRGPRMQGNLMVPVFIGCPPGKRLAFDITYTVEYSRLKNKHYFDCVHVNPEMPCFLFRDSVCPVPSPAQFTALLPPPLCALPPHSSPRRLPTLFPAASHFPPSRSSASRAKLISSSGLNPLQPHSFLPLLLDSRFGDRRLRQFPGQSVCTSVPGSYVLLVVGGGPTMDSLKDYSEDEIYRFNSPLDKTNSLIWTTRTTRTTKDSAFHIMSHESPGIEWLCLENAPCYDSVPQGIFAPEFFFKVLVSNRGVDTSTYCNYQLTFLLHIHGLPLSPKRALFIVMVSASVFVGLVIFYIAFCLLWPLVVKGCTMIRWKINDIIASESYYTYASISGISSMPSLRHSRMGSMFSSRMTEDRAEPKEAVERQLMT